jgi:acyl-coenzyme A synthetase/AMP-(fatty) acid ligase
LTEADPGGESQAHGMHVLQPAQSGVSRLTPPEGNPVVSCHYTYKGLGHPLGVEHKYNDYTFCLASLSATFPGVGGGSHFVGLPVHAIYGLTSSVFAPLLLGGRIVLTQKSFEIDPVDILERHQIRFACVVPFLLQRLVSKARKRIGQGQPLRLHPDLEIVSGGSHLPVDLAEEAAGVLGVRIYQGYGTTETLPVIGTSPGHYKTGSMGVPFSSLVEVRIVRSDWNECPPRVAGVIAIRGPGVVSGFRGSPAGTDSCFHEGWFNTGDLGYKDEEGYLYFVGRASAFTKVASQMVDVAEVESVLCKHPGVAQARVTVRRRADLGEVLTASVIPEPNTQLTERELKLHCRKFISSFKVPRDIRFCQGR